MLDESGAMNYTRAIHRRIPMPSQTKGLGTDRWLSKGPDEIQGVAILSGDVPDLMLLSVRLAPSLSELAPVIVRQVERDAPRFPQ
jgi:hypothetical protein